ncbi:MAG: LamG domain-containing protein [Phycisphaerales bacterium]|nr:MAG: LamG domain-containing protein [Phycisphaerales bacterium]
MQRQTRTSKSLLIALTVLTLASVSAHAVENNFHAVMNANGWLEEGWCDGPYPEWYFYRESEWWNQWFDNQPYEPTGRKVMSVSLTVSPMFPGAPGEAEIAFNWSTPEWCVSCIGHPPFPDDVLEPGAEDRYIERKTFFSGPVRTTQVIDYTYTIEDYCPGWVSIDIRGRNFIVDGVIRHECILPPDQACCFPDGSCEDLPATECSERGGEAQGAGSTCADATCPRLTQACCLPDGTCIDTDPDNCDDLGGTPQGLGTDCTMVDCECNWDPGDGHKMHWPQMPAKGRWDVEFANSTLADDWRCSGTGPVEDIHFWVSWMMDMAQEIDNVTVTIYSDNPDPDGPTGPLYSTPGDRLWVRNFALGEFTLRDMPYDWQGWFDPSSGAWRLRDHARWQQINICHIPDPFIQEAGKIYWLAINFGELRYVGWKVSESEHFNDDGVWWDEAGKRWIELRDPTTRESLDLAFVITGEGGPPPLQACCLPDGTCIDTTVGDCLDQGGTPQGIGTDCSTVDCPVCDWTPGKPHKMHWPQLPDLDPTGVDVEWERLGVHSLADDFLCSATGPITDIHIWCSFYDDILPSDGPGSLSFYLSIRANRPAGDGVLFSMPQGDPLWSRTFGPGEYTVQLVHEGPQGWYNPGSLATDYEPDNHKQTYQYNFCIEEDPFIQEEGIIYWLEVGASPSGRTDSDIRVGWKTTQRDLRWNDDAVKAHALAGVTMYSRLQYPYGHEYEQETLDLAFVITGEPGPPPERQACCLPDGTCENLTPVRCAERGGTLQGPGSDCTTVDCPGDCDWQVGDPHKMHFPQLPDPDGWDMDITEPHVSADDWKCSETGPVTDIHFWYSWLGDRVGIIDNVHASIHADDRSGSYSKPGELLWSRDFGPGEFNLCLYGEGDQGFIQHVDAAGGGLLAHFNDHQNIYQCDIVGIPDPFVQREGNIYWLDISIKLRDRERTRIGWKTSREHFEDFAVGDSPSGGWGVWVDPAGNSLDLAFVITGDGGGPGERLEFGDAPEAALAYPSICVQGAFPTCINVGPAGWIQHNNFGAYFGPRVDFELDGNAGLCPLFNPNTYNRDECSQDGDAGLITPAAYTITGPIGSETVVPCIASQTAALGRVCDMAVWGANVDIDVHNHMPSGTIGYVNVLMDFNRDGSWPGSTTCPGTPPTIASEHVLVNFPVPNPYDGPLSALNPPNFQIGAYPGYVWTRFTITEKPVAAATAPWNGEGKFEDGESEDYLLYIRPVKKPFDCDWHAGDSHKMHWPQLPDLSPTGMDVDMFWTPLADDFRCSETGPVRDIHIWGSFADDCLPPQGVGGLTFQLTIYSNVPEDPLIPWSRPGEPLWTRQFNPCEYTVRQVADDAVEDWYDPATQLYRPANHFKAYQYNFCITDDDPFIQKEGTIYWLEVKDIQPEGEEARYTFGWKTTSPELHYMDDAVWFNPDPAVPGGWLPLKYPPGHRYAGQTIDLAFVITGDGEPGPRDMDFGDAPDPTYPTLLANGARHIIVPGVFLGNNIDPEPEGQPDATATGDDNDGNDDEDGVVFTSPLIPGGVTTVDVTASVRGILNAWCDFDGNGDWGGAGEDIFVDTPLNPGLNNLSFNVPAGATAGVTFGRFRFSRIRGLTYTGLAPDGEVEDYEVTIEKPYEGKPPVRHLKWSQPPVEWYPRSTVPLYCGWDEPSICGAPTPAGALGCKIVADDFRCIGRMPVTSIHWWGSHLGWSESSPPHLPMAFHIGFWTNVPADPDADIPFSRPGRLIWEQYRRRADYEVEFAGYDRFPRADELIADNPEVDVDGTEDFSWTAWKGWWLRGDTAAVDFKFTGIDTAAISGTHVLVRLNLGVTNHANGEAGLDGLVDITVNPGMIGWTYTLNDVLLNNLDPSNHVYAMGTGGAYETKACISVPKDYIRHGTLTIRVHRHADVKDGLPVAPVSTNQPIDMSTTPPTVPAGCYDFDDAHTAHIYVETTDSTGAVAANGEVTLWDVIDERETCFQYYTELHPDEYFWQDKYVDPDTGDTVFWISITAIYDEVADLEFPWGWKTRPWHWMDDAVTFEVNRDALTLGLAPDAAAVTPIEDAPLCCKLRSYDMSFELDTDPNYIKWERPFTGLRHWPHYEDEESIATGRTVTETVTKYVQEPDLSTAGMDVDATAEEWAEWQPQILADDFPCDTTGPITDIHIWGSWYHDNVPVEGPGALTFTLSIHMDIPADKSPTGYSMPGERLWTHDFLPGEFNVSTHAIDLSEGYYIPCEPRYEWPGDNICYKYDFYINPSDAFTQKGSPDDRKVYWLVVQAHVRPTPGAAAPRFGWKTSKTQWNDDAVWAIGVGPLSGGWKELTHPQTGDSLDLAFAITTEQTVEDELNIRRLVADDWLCDARTPVTSAVWWGSYIGYKYQACACPQPQQPPVKPDYFLLSIWTDVPDPDPDNPEDYSHPGQKIWEYRAYDYDEVLVGYDKHPEVSPAIYPRIGQEPVFRYSVRLPQERWFCQEEVDGVYWFSVVAVYEDPEGPPYPWGWTNHQCAAWEPPGLDEVGHWRFDEASGPTAHDSSGNGNHATLAGDPIWQSCCGIVCGALDFDGDGDYVKTSDATTGLDFAPGSFSVSAWVSAASVSDGWRTILEYDRDGSDMNRFGLWLNNSGGLHFRVGKDTKNSNQTLNADQWYCLTATYDSADKTMRLYIDGQFDSSEVHANGYNSANAAKLTIGVRGWEDAEYFSGLIDDVRIYDRVLGADEIKALAKMDRNDDAVAGHLDTTAAAPTWVWEELYDQVGASEDMSFVLFTEPGCLPCCHKDYFEWLRVGKPDCWCYPRQCHGDADGVSYGSPKTGIYYVGPADLNTLVAAWLVKEPPAGPGIASVPNGICADFAHDQGGSPKTGVYRVGPSDLNILISNWFKKEPPFGPGVDPNCLDCP